MAAWRTKVTRHDHITHSSQLEVSFILSSSTNSQVFRGCLTSGKMISYKIQQPHHRPSSASHKHTFAGYGTHSLAAVTSRTAVKTKRRSSSEKGKQGENPGQILHSVPPLGVVSDRQNLVIAHSSFLTSHRHYSSLQGTPYCLHRERHLC